MTFGKAANRKFDDASENFGAFTAGLDDDGSPPTDYAAKSSVLPKKFLLVGAAIIAVLSVVGVGVLTISSGPEKSVSTAKLSTSATPARPSQSTDAIATNAATEKSETTNGAMSSLAPRQVFRAPSADRLAPPRGERLQPPGLSNTPAEANTANGANTSGDRLTATTLTQPEVKPENNDGLPEAPRLNPATSAKRKNTQTAAVATDASLPVAQTLVNRPAATTTPGANRPSSQPVTQPTSRPTSQPPQRPVSQPETPPAAEVQPVQQSLTVATAKRPSQTVEEAPSLSAPRPTDVAPIPMNAPAANPLGRPDNGAIPASTPITSPAATPPTQITKATIKKRVPPIYPKRCRRRAEAVESVRVAFDIDTTGRPFNLRVSSSTNECLNRAALNAVEKWRYNPRLENNVSVERQNKRVKIQFALN